MWRFRATDPSSKSRLELQPKVDIKFDHIGAMDAPGILNKHRKICRQSFVEEQSCGEQMFVQTLSSTGTMLFLWSAAVHARLYFLHNHGSKSFVEQSCKSNGPKVRDQCSLAVCHRHREQSPSPARRAMSMWKQIIV